MSFERIQRFLALLAESKPQANGPYLRHCNEVWLQVANATDFQEFHVVVEQAIQSVKFLQLDEEGKESLATTLEEVRASFNVSKLLANAPDVWNQDRNTFPLLARSIRQGVTGNKLTPVQETELLNIEDEVGKLKAISDNSEALEPEARAAIREITDLLNSAISRIRTNGLADFTLTHPFLFGQLSLIFKRETSDFGEMRNDLIELIKRIWTFGNVANTGADMYGKLLSIVS